MFLLRHFFVGCVLFCSLVSGQVLRPGRCPDVKYAQVDWEKMQGQWFYLERFPEFHPALYYIRCSSEIKVQNPNGTVNVLASNVNTQTGVKTKDLFVTLIIPGSDNPSIVTTAGIIDALPAYTYYLLDVDYDSHHLLYGCVEAGPDKKWSLEYVGIFSRSPKPLMKGLKWKLYRRLTDNDINPDFLDPIDQKQCPKTHGHGYA